MHATYKCKNRDKEKSRVVHVVGEEHSVRRMCLSTTRPKDVGGRVKESELLVLFLCMLLQLCASAMDNTAAQRVWD